MRKIKGAKESAGKESAVLKREGSGFLPLLKSGERHDWRCFKAVLDN